jgi:NAD(P)-dependent dehydrogenase (short-subunit alcohol dehydrogenase family)
MTAIRKSIMKNLFSIEGKVTVMTGACGVLGGTIVKHFVEQGAKVVMLDLESTRNIAESLIKGIASDSDAPTNPDEDFSSEVCFFPTDVLDKSKLEENYSQILDRYGRIDILMNAAGGNMKGATVPPDKTIFDLDVDAVKLCTELNLFGTVYPTLTFAKAMAEQKCGSIINFASEAALRPLTRVAGYGVAKAAVVNWTKYLSAELAMKFSCGIRVNAIAPGFLLTNQNRSLLTNPDGSLTKRSHDILSHTPFGRFLEPEELVGTLQWLASDASRAVTGTVTVIDGGFDSFSI